MTSRIWAVRSPAKSGWCGEELHGPSLQPPTFLPKRLCYSCSTHTVEREKNPKSNTTVKAIRALASSA
jgi:hypothetical protein